jgi:dolichol kinase
MGLQSFLGTLEFRRKTAHILFGIFFVLLINTEFFQPYLLYLVTFALICAISLSLIVKYYKPNFIMLFLEKFDKPRDLKTFPGKGAVFYVAGVLVSLLLFDTRVASASILILALGDPAAQFVGSRFGRIKLMKSRKVLEGTIAGIVFGTVGASFFLTWSLAFLGSLFGMLIEIIDLEGTKLDDNLLIPVVAGAAITLFSTVF